MMPSAPQNWQKLHTPAINRPQPVQSLRHGENCRLTLNILLSFAQFEREVIGERIRDKIAGSTPSGVQSARVLRQPI